ncbi:hypothetical protein [Nocardia carnea]|uniref:hypothetical protein n=1 Tax=Nocardia carnea TaxID=37328 RepID=UPI002453C509|nr:hypothetical protein [Nocardia carnea]
MPHSHLRFENPSALPHDEVVDILNGALSDRSREYSAAEALVGIALNDDDREFIERCCLEVGTRAVPGSPLLGLAGLCLGHTARRFGSLSNQAVALAEALAARADTDSSDVDGRALDGRDDIRWYLRDQVEQ